MKSKLLLTIFLLCSISLFSQTALFEWAGKVGSSGTDHGEAISVDSLGNVYVIGHFYGTIDFNPGPGVFNLVSNGGRDIFIQKLDSSGALVWAQNFGGIGDDAGLGIVVDSAGVIYATGDFSNTVDFDPSGSQYNMISSGSRDIFILNLTTSGGFGWARRSGSSSWDGGRNITMTNNGDILVSGWFHNTIDINMGTPFVGISSAGNLDGFLVRMTSLGSYVWGKRIGGSGFDACYRLEEDNSGDIFVTGVFENTADFDPGTGTQNMTSSGDRDGYLLKIDSLGNYLWVKKIGGSGSDSGNFLDVDGVGNVYLQGKFQGTVDFDSGPSNTFMTSAGSDDVFVVKLSTSGSLQWARKFGGTSSDLGQGLKTDYLGNTYLTGHFQGVSDFNPGTGVYNLTSNGSYDIYICKLSVSGNFVWARSIGGSGYDSGKAIELTGSGSVVSTGWFRNTVDFDANSATYNLSSSGGDDVYVTKFRVCYPTTATIAISTCDSYTSPSGNYLWSTTGTYTDIISNSAGCDSIITINLSINNSFTTETITNCGDYVSPSGNFTWTTSGVYNDTLQNTLGCDSVVTYNLTINSNTSASLSPVTCSPYTSPSGNYSWNNSGLYLDTIPSGNGCDIIFTINLIVNTPSNSTNNIIACNAYVSPSGNYTWTNSGTYYDTIPNAVNCDSLMIFNLTINQSSSSTISPSVCASYTSPSGNNTWTTSGTYVDVIPNSVGCDSVITINLSVNNTYASISPTACNSYTSPSGKVWSASGIYQDTITNSVGCDSIISIDLTVGVHTLTNISASSCGSYSWALSGLTYLNSGMHTQVLTSVLGCDSVVVLDLTITLPTSAIISVIACDSYVSPSGINTWTSSGVYTDVMLNAAGCDSVITINLTVNRSSSAIQSVASCGAYLWSVNGITYPVGGIYISTISNSAGCDSVITLNLAINSGSSGMVSVSNCGSYTWVQNGSTYSVSGQYFDTVNNSVGCDSIITLNLTINSATTGNETVVTCNSYTSPSGNYNWTTSGTYMDTIPNSVGCDSIITTYLTINGATYATVNAVACNFYMWSLNSQLYNVSGNYLDTIPNSNGCDSIITLALTINSSTSSSSAVSACNSYLWSQNGQVYSLSGTYSDTVLNSVGCDSVITLILTVNSPTSSLVTITNCGSFIWPQNGSTYNTSGQFMDTVSNTNGCDSVITLNLTINNPTSGTEIITACNSYTSPSGNYNWTSSGTYSDTIANSLGCDSLITTILTINNATSSTQTVTACDSYFWGTKGQTYTSSGSFTDTVMNSVGCDSVINLNLTINNSHTSIVYQSSCNAYTWALNGITYTQSGSYSDTMTTVTGCDSILTLDLQINSNDSVIENIISCGSYFWNTTGNTYITSGNYQALLSNSNGCDSLVTLNLIISSASIDTAAMVACNSYQWSQNGNTYTTSGFYVDSLTSSLGCDSIIVLDLTINNSSSNTLTETSCGVYTAPDGSLYTTSGQYMATIPNSAGCDSVITINLIVTSIDTTVMESGFELSAVALGYSYQWLDCNNGMNPITGATNSVFIPSQSGSYAVNITDGVCLEQSNCHVVTGVGIDELDQTELSFFPNPVLEELTIQVGKGRITGIRITDNSGSLVYRIKINSKINIVDFSDFAKGVYFVQVETESGVFTEKIIKP